MMKKKYLLALSLLFSFLTVFLPFEGVHFPMYMNTTLVRGFPFSFLGFHDLPSYESIFSFFPINNILFIGFNFLNFSLNVFCIFLLLSLIQKILLRFQIVKK